MLFLIGIFGPAVSLKFGGAAGFFEHYFYEGSWSGRRGADCEKAGSVWQVFWGWVGGGRFDGAGGVAVG